MYPQLLMTEDSPLLVYTYSACCLTVVHIFIFHVISTIKTLLEGVFRTISAVCDYRVMRVHQYSEGSK